MTGNAMTARVTTVPTGKTATPCRIHSTRRLGKSSGREIGLGPRFVLRNQPAGLGKGQPAAGRHHHFIIELTNTCNFACKYCYLGQARYLKSPTHSTTMSEETGLRVVNYLATLLKSPADTVVVDFLNGEPLMNFKTIKAMVSFAADAYPKKSFTFRYTTNGSLLTPSIYKFSKRHGIYFNISMDGSPACHDANRVDRKGRPTSDLVQSALDLVQDKDEIGVVSTYSPGTCHQIINGTRYLMARGVKHLEISFCQGKVDYTDEQRRVCTEQYGQALDLFLNRYSAGDFSCLYVELDKRLESVYSGRPMGMACSLPWRITTDGRIQGCDRVPSERNAFVGAVESGIQTPASHYCRSLMVPRCRDCSYAPDCSPCKVYAADLYNPERARREPMFCVIMKVLIDKVRSFYRTHRRNRHLVHRYGDFNKVSLGGRTLQLSNALPG